MRRGFPIFLLATLPTRALFTAILLRWYMGYHVAAADKRRIALLSSYETTLASIKAAPSGCPASAAFRSIDEKHFSREDLKSPFRALQNISASLVATVLIVPQVWHLLTVARFRDILEFQ